MANIVITKLNKSIILEYNDLAINGNPDRKTISISSLSEDDSFDTLNTLEVTLDSGTVISLKASEVDSIEGVTITTIDDLKTEFGKFFSLGDSTCSDPISMELDATNTAFNFFTPIAGREFIITGIVVNAGGNVNPITPAEIVIYEATTAVSTEVAKQLFRFDLIKSQSLPIPALSICVNEGVYINAKTTDDTVFITIMGYHI